MEVSPPTSKQAGDHHGKVIVRTARAFEHWITQHPRDIIGYATAYGAPMAGIALTSPLVSVLPVGPMSPVIAFTATALARFRLRQITVGNLYALLHAAGLSSAFGQILSLLGFMSLGTTLGPVGKTIQSHLGSLALGRGGFQAPLLGLGLATLTTFLSNLGMMPALVMGAPMNWSASVTGLSLSSIRAIFEEMGSFALFKGTHLIVERARDWGIAQFVAQCRKSGMDGAAIDDKEKQNIIEETKMDGMVLIREKIRGSIEEERTMNKEGISTTWLKTMATVSTQWMKIFIESRVTKLEQLEVWEMVDQPTSIVRQQEQDQEQDQEDAHEQNQAYFTNDEIVERYYKQRDHNLKSEDIEILNRINLAGNRHNSNQDSSAEEWNIEKESEASKQEEELRVNFEEWGLDGREDDHQQRADMDAPTEGWELEGEEFRTPGMFHMNAADVFGVEESMAWGVSSESSESSESTGFGEERLVYWKPEVF